MDYGWTKFNDEIITRATPWKHPEGEVGYMLLYKCNDWNGDQSSEMEGVAIPPQAQVNPGPSSPISIPSDPETSSSRMSTTAHHEQAPATPISPRALAEMRQCSEEYHINFYAPIDRVELGPMKMFGGRDWGTQISVLMPEDVEDIISFDEIKKRYANSMKRYFKHYAGPDHTCNHSDLIYHTFDGYRKQDRTPNNSEETLALMKIWRETLSAIAYSEELRHGVRMWKLRKGHQDIPPPPSDSDRNTWDKSSSQSSSDEEVEDNVNARVPIKIWGTNFKLGVYCLRVSWTPVQGVPDEPTWEPVRAFWERWQDVDEVRNMIEETVKTWNL